MQKQLPPITDKPLRTWGDSGHAIPIVGREYPFPAAPASDGMQASAPWLVFAKWEATKQSTFGPAIYFASCYGFKACRVLVFGVGQKIKRCWSCWGRKLRLRQVIRTWGLYHLWGQFYLEGNGRTQVYKMKNTINIHPKRGHKNTFVDKTSAKLILPTAKVALYLLMRQRQGIFSY